MDCSVCAKTFNQSINKEVICPNPECSYSACKECIRTYLTTTVADPHCMACKRPYESEFQTRNLNSSWVKGVFREHRKQLLVEREIAQIPQTMPFVERYNQLSNLRARLAEYKQQIERLKQTLNDTIAEKDAVTNMIRDIEAGSAGPAEKRAFVMPCSYDGCNGFLSTQYKCGVCARYTCSRCHCGIGDQKTNPEHTCNPDDVKSAEAIKQDSKPCPTCGTRISRVSGCAQMWCPNCKQAWNWNTGRIDNGYIHNPHFQEWQSAGGTRMPGDAVCGGPPSFRMFNGLGNHTYSDILTLEHVAETKYVCDPAWFPDVKRRDRIEKHASSYPALGMIPKLMSLCSTARWQLRNLHHICGLVLPDARTAVRTAQNNELLRAKFIMKEITKEKFASEIIKRDGVRKKEQDLLHIWELLATIGTESFLDVQQDMIRLGNKLGHQQRCRTLEEYTNVLSEGLKRMNILHKKISSLIAYCNYRFGIVSATYSLMAPILTDDLEIRKQKQTSKFFKEDPPDLIC